MIKVLIAIMAGLLIASCSPIPQPSCESESGVVGTGIVMDVIDLEATTGSC